MKASPAGEELRFICDARSVIISILRFSVKDLPLEEILGYALEQVVAAPFLPFLESGCVLAEKEGGFYPIAVSGLPPGIARRAGEAAGRYFRRAGRPFAETGIIQIPGAGPAFFIPVVYRAEILGALLLFPGGKKKISFPEEGKEFISAVSNVLAGIIVRKKSEHEASKVRMELRSAKRLADIGALAAAVAHELRSPLAVIKMAAANIRKKSGGGSIETHLSSIESRVFECDRIISNLLFYAKLKKPRFEKTDLYDIILSCILEAEKISRSGAAVKRNLRKVKNVSVRVDPVQFREVLGNILLNAFEAMEGKQGTVLVRAEIDVAGRPVVSIEDEGEGIDGHAARKIFSPFWTTKAKGNGLGLTVSESIMKLHGGAIEVESEKGKGSVFKVVLPSDKKC